MADGSIKIDTLISKDGLKDGLKDIQDKMKDSAKKMESSFGVFSKNFKDNLKKNGARMRDFGKNMSKYVTAPLVALGGTAFAAADQMDKAYREIAVGTGATGKALEELKDSFKEVFRNVPDDANTVASALAGLNTFTGATGETLEKLTKGVLDAARALGEDGVGASEAFGKAMNQWQIPVEDGNKHLDYLLSLTQDYGVSLQGLNGTLTAYGPILKNAGFEMNEAAHYFAIMEANGISVSRTMPALNAAFRNWAAEGKNSREEFEKVIETIKNTEDSQEALALATEVFGAQGAQRLMTAIRNGIIPSFDELGSGIEDTIGLTDELTAETRTIGEEFQILKNNTMESLEPIGHIMLELAKEYLPPLIEAVQKVAEWFRDLSPQAQLLTLVILGIIAALPPLIMLAGSLAIAIAGITWPVLAVIAAITAVIAIGVLLWKNWDTIKAKAIEIWNGIKDFFIGLFDKIIGIFTKALDWIDEKTNGAFKHVTDTIRDAMNTSLKIVKDIFKFIENTFKNGIAFIKAIFTGDFEQAKNIFRNQLQSIKDFASNILNAIRDFFSRTWDRIISKVKSFSTSFIRVWNGIKNGIRNVINPIIRFINKLIGGIESMVNAVGRGVNSMPSFKIPSWVPKYGGNEFGLPKFPNVSLKRIPSLDVGTDLVTRDGLAMIHAGEKIVPAETTGPYRGVNDGEPKQPAEINVYVGTKKIANEIVDDINELTDRKNFRKRKVRKGGGS